MDALTAPTAPGVPEHAAKRRLWDEFCLVHAIAGTSVPLFAADAEGLAEVFPYGCDRRPMLRRAPAMESLVVDAVERMLAAPPADIEGVLHVMLRLDGEDVVPLYVGKAGRYGCTGVISANIAAIHGNAGKFARWGYDYAYHMGDLSAAVLPGHPPAAISPKYLRWAQLLFETVRSSTPRLRASVRFWCTAWGPHSPGMWSEFGSCPLAFMEYLLIGVAGLLFPNDLLNSEGVNRAAATPEDG